MSEGEINWVRAMAPRDYKLNILLLALPITCYYAYIEHDESMAFFSSLVAIMPLAFLMGRATEEIALRTSESVGGLLNATFGNAAEMIIAFLAIYAASKAALIALTKGIAHEGAPYVTANAILPGPTNRQLAEERTKPIQIQENEPVNWLGIPIPISRKGIPEDIAHTVVFFSSDASEYITGQSLHVSGG